MLRQIYSRSTVAIASVGLACGLGVSAGQAQAADVPALQELGKRVFFDEISRPRGKQSCASCHDPAAGWTGPKAKVNKTTVAIPGAAFHRTGGTAIGSLKPPANAYATFIQPFSDDQGDCPGGPPPAIGFCGGNFWDGRAEGGGNLGKLYAGATEPIGDEVFTHKNGKVRQDLKDAYSRFLGPVAEQALNPFPNDVEQNVKERQVCRHVKKADYAELFKRAWGKPIRCNENTDANGVVNFRKSFKRIAVALGAWQASDEVNSFSSKRDKALRAELACLDPDPWNNPDYDHEVCLNDDSLGEFPLYGLTDLENYGHDLFYAVVLPFGPNNPGNPVPAGTKTGCSTGHVTTSPRHSNCSFCHSDDPDNDDGAEEFQLYADDHFHNIRTPKNRVIPFIAVDGPNPGLAGHTGLLEQTGLFKTPTLRNVDKRKRPRFVKAYGHNGWFKSLESIVQFYNTAAVKQTCESLGIIEATEAEAKANDCWPAPEHPLTASPAPLVGALGLDSCDESALVAYMKTLTDEETVEAPGPFGVDDDDDDDDD